jgi:hypothetical protein
MFRANFRPGPIALSLTLAALAGCSSSGPVPRHSSGYIVGTQGAGSEVVFHGVQVAGAELAADAELTRNDQALAYRDLQTAFDADAWPAPPGPTLDAARYLSLPRNPQTYLYLSNFRSRFYTGGFQFRPGYVYNFGY